MAGEIINRVANSKLVTLDLEDYYPEGDRILLDMQNWLYEGLVLREQDFREVIKNHEILEKSSKITIGNSIKESMLR